MYNKLSEEFNVDKTTVQELYNNYWKYFRNTLETMDFTEEYSEDEFNSLRTSFNLPNLGKLLCTFKKYKSVKYRDNYLKHLKDDKDKKDKSKI